MSEKVYNKHIIIKVTWSGILYHISWMRYTIGWLSTLCVSGDPMVWPHQLDVIQCARSSYYYNNVYLHYSYKHSHVNGNKNSATAPAAPNQDAKNFMLIFIYSFLHYQVTELTLFQQWPPGLEVITFFSCSTQLNTKFILLINVKMPTFFGILTFISMINTTSERLKARNVICLYLSLYEQLKFRAQLSWAWKKFYNLGPCIDRTFKNMKYIKYIRSYVFAPLYFTGSSEYSDQTPILRTVSVTGNRMDAVQNFHTFSNDRHF